MPFPSFNYLGASFTPAQQTELEQFVAYLQGYLSHEHKDSGAHSTVTADSVTVAGPVSATGDGSFANGAVTVTSALPTGTSTRRAGIKIFDKQFADPIGARAWAIGVDNNLPNAAASIGALEQVFGIWDLISSDVLRNSFPALVIAYSSTSGDYHVLPHQGVGSQLGSSSAGGRWTEVHSLITRALTGFYERGRTTALGGSFEDTFAAGNYTTDGTVGTSWTVATGNVATHCAEVTGDFATVFFEISSTTLVGTPTFLKVKIPGGLSVAAVTGKWGGARTPCELVVNGTAEIGFAYARPGATSIELYRIGGAWAAGNTGVLGQLRFRI